MGESEIQSLISFVLSSRQIVRLFVVRHSVPFLVPALIAPDIVYLGQQVYEHVGNNESHQSTIASPVAGSII